ncbi:MAG: AAA family ATPase [Candidatus Pacebacteria bacterium]|nr:AAA family ATPase [Candidatus Paceibacterota bacterium]
MIEKITIKNEASFNDEGESINNLKKINFFYGSNGSGKTTISRIISNQEEYPDCSLSWKTGAPIRTLVYNRDFITRNFSPDKDLAGIFTLGEHDASVVENIATTKKDHDDIIKKINNKRKTLQGEDGNSGKNEELKTLEDKFTEQCWTYKKKYEAVFEDAFIGCKKPKEKFKTRLLKETENNNATIFPLEYLKEKAKTVFADDLVKEDLIPPILYNNLIGLESAEILSKKVIGKDDVDIATMIKNLGNSDWVKQGRAYYNQNDEYCPFCQQKTDTAFANSLEKYFNETYLNDITIIETLTTNYDEFSDSITQRIEGILNAAPKYLDCEKFQAHKDVFEALIRANKQHIARKKKEASTIVTLETLQDVMNEIAVEITDANTKVKEHNDTIDNLSKEKRTLTFQIWRFIVEEIKLTYETYVTEKLGINTAIVTLQTDIINLEKKEKEKSGEIKELEKKITSIQPTIDAINLLLKSFGFVGFSLKPSGQKGFYKIVRPNGEYVEETLSEGEKSFVTFLYFYHLMKGSNTESGITENRVVVFDDPVSSLDSDILFIVSHLIKGIFEEIHSGSGDIKQVFILTHNIYFHKEICFKTKGSHAFWIIKKNNNDCSIVEAHKTNPIKNSYELLWQEVQNPNRSTSTIRNTLRRILEYYFKILGGVNLDKIADGFEGKEKMICGVLLSWVHDGSHFSDEDLYIACNTETVEKYLKVFKGIFEESKQIGHYNMMMKISETDETINGLNLLEEV